MRRLAFALVTLLPIAAIAGDLPCARKAVRFQSVPHDRESPVTLEAQRVRSIDGDTIRYDLGREVVTIEADSGAASRFIREVAQGRCSARADVSLVPVRKSPFNDRFKAARPH